MAARTSGNLLRRAMLYVPGSSQKMLAKSALLNVDSIIYDLEDSVAPDAKESARHLVADHIARTKEPTSPGVLQEYAVRVNAVESGLALQDLSHLMSVSGNSLDTVVLPKVHSAADVKYATDIIQQLAPHRSISNQAMHTARENAANGQPGTARPLHIIGLIESARGLTNVNEICRLGGPLGLTGLAFAAEDFVADLELSKLPDRRELLFARSSLVTACRAHGISSILDMVSVDLGQTCDQGGQTLEEESYEGRCLGFTGKQAIHPSQVKTIQQVFQPSESEIRWAISVADGHALALAEGRGAWKLQGKMIDAPVVAKAAAVLEKAKACGINLDAYRKRED